jgi:hypothetical protein
MDDTIRETYHLILQLRIGIKKYVKPMIKYETKESYPFIGTYFPLGEACIALTHKEADDALIS